MKTITSQIAKEKGNKFEEFIAKKFSREYFTIKEWRSDKYVDGIYAESNLNPDLELEYRLRDISIRFAVECKYRQRLYNGYVELGKERQLYHYRNFQHERNIPVYIVLGLGGTAEQPDELFIIPLDDLDTPLVSQQYLQDFKKDVHEHFYFDVDGYVLR